MASTDPTGAPKRASPRLPFPRWSWALTCGMCATHDAKRRPWMKKTAVTARRALCALDEPRIRGRGTTSASDAAHVDAGTDQLVDDPVVDILVSHQDIDRLDLADVSECDSPDLR
jgi:hypothetical protein